MNSFIYKSQKNMNNNVGTWIAAGVVVILIVVGLVWLNKKEEVPANSQTATSTATSTASVSTNTVAFSKEVRTTATVSAVIASLPEASTFSSYLTATGVSGSVTGTGPYTIFVPTNAAFGKLAPGTVSALSAAAKKRLVQYHVVSGKKLDVDALEKSTIRALSMDMLNFEALGPQSGGRVNNSIVVRQYNAKNGVVYIIDAVLLPPEAPLN